MRKAKKPKGAKKTRVTTLLPTKLTEAIKNTAVALSGPPLRLTLTAMFEAAMRAEVKRLEKEHNDGKPFPQRDSEMRGGRIQS